MPIWLKEKLFQTKMLEFLIGQEPGDQEPEPAAVFRAARGNFCSNAVPSPRQGRRRCINTGRNAAEDLNFNYVKASPRQYQNRRTAGCRHGNQFCCVSMAVLADYQ